MTIQQRIADGIVKWLREEAPETIEDIMTKSDVERLVRSICDQFQQEDFEQPEYKHQAYGVRPDGTIGTMTQEQYDEIMNRGTGPSGMPGGLDTLVGRKP